jgi:FeS assembly SUF system protein
MYKKRKFLFEKMEKSIETLERDVVDMIRTCYDPEIPVNIYELGLIYGVTINEEHDVHVLMTLTSPSCPVAETLPPDVEQKIAGVEGVKSAKVEITFEPPWEQSMMSEEAKLELGFL